MLETNGIPPKLSGRECQELICQQYWYQGKLENEVDMLSIKANDRWHLLYFENGVIYWRLQKEGPKPFEEKDEDPFKYPHIDLAAQYGIKGHMIEDCESQAMPDGARVIITFEHAGKVIVSCMDNQTRIQYIKE